MRRLWLSPLVLILACGDDPKTTPADDTGTTTTGDTETDSDTDTDTDSDTDTDTDTDTTPVDSDSPPEDSVPIDTGPETPPSDDALLTFVVDGEWEDSAITLTRVALVDGQPSYQEEATGVFLSTETVTIVVPEPDPSLLSPVGDGSFSAVIYLATIHLDDGNGTHDDGEVYTGASDYMIIYAQGSIPVEFAGMVEGWNAVKLDFSAGVLEDVADMGAIPIETSLAAITSTSVGGSYAGSIDIGLLHLVSIPVLASGTPSDFLYDGVLTDPWSIVFSGDPPASHIQTFDETSGLTYAVELMGAYQDANGNGTFDPGTDTGGYPACAGSDLAVVYWISPPTTIAQLYTALGGDFPVGWFPALYVQGATEITPLGASDAAALQLGDTCSFPS